MPCAWLRANAEKYHVDPARIGAYGNSAGGHLALLLAMMPPTIGGDGAPYAEQSSRVQAAASDSGPLDLVAGHEQNRLRGVIEKFMSGPPALVRLPEYRQASPASYVQEKTPPLLLIYGEADGQVNVSDADQFVTALAAQEIRTSAIFVWRVSIIVHTRWYGFLTCSKSWKNSSSAHCGGRMTQSPKRRRGLATSRHGQRSNPSVLQSIRVLQRA